MNKRLLLVLLLALPATSAPTSAQGCEQGQTGCPAAVVDNARWGDLEPRGILDDTTWFVGDSGEPNCADKRRIPFWFDVDIEGGYLFAAAGEAVEIFDARVNRGYPGKAQELCRPIVGGIWPTSDENWSLKSIDAPPDDPSVAIVGVGSNAGTLVLQAESDGTYGVIYRDRDLEVDDVVALQAGGRTLGVALRGDRIDLYDLDAARARTRPCVETTRTGAVGCPGIWLGRLTQGGSTVQALYVAGAGAYLVALGATQFSVFDLSDVESPELVSVGVLPTTLTMPAQEPRPLTTWMQGNRLWVAVANKNPYKQVMVFDARVDDPSSTLATLVTTIDVSSSISLSSRLSSSVDGGTPLLWVGSDNWVSGGPQREFLYDMTDPSDPIELTPFHPDGYWGWYYQGNPTGFNRVAPFAAVVADGFLYRAAASLLDVHELLGEDPPVAAFVVQAPDPVFVGDSIELLDASSRRPQSWSWDLDGLATSTQQHLTWVVPECPSSTYPCDRQITLTVENDYGSTSATRTITVYDPDSAPMQVLRFDVRCQKLLCEASAGQPVSFDFEYNGRPEAFDYDWDGNGSFEDSGHPTPKLEHTYQYGGTFSPRVRVRRTDDEAIASSDPEEIFVDGPPAPSPDIFNDGFETGSLENWQ